MDRNRAEIRIGAALEPSVRKSTGQAGKAITGLDKDQKKAAKTTAAARTETARLGQTMSRTQRETGRAGRALNQVADAANRSDRALESAGREADKTTRKFGRLAKAKDRLSKGIGSGGGGSGFGVGSIATGIVTGIAARSSFGNALAFEDAGVRLGTVINDDDRETALGEALQSARQYGLRNITGETEILDIQYALNSAGFTADLARLGSQTVAKVAKITGGTAERTGEVVATVYNNLGDQLEGDAEQRLTRVGELLTKTQFKFQIRNFDQLGESMKEASSSIARFNVPLEQGLTLVGKLNSAGLQGSMAGTALSATLRQLSRASQELGTELVRDADGQLDVIETLEQVRDALDAYDIDTRNDIIQKLFGDEGAKGLTPLMQSLDELRTAQRDVTESSRGLVDTEYQKFLKSTSGQLKRFQNIVGTIGAVVVGTFLPAVNSLLGPISEFLVGVAGVVETVPALGQAIAVVGAGLAIVKAVSAARLVGGALRGLRNRQPGAAGPLGSRHRGPVPVRVVNPGGLGGDFGRRRGRKGARGRAGVVGRIGSIAGGVGSSIVDKGGRFLSRAFAPLAIGLGIMDAASAASEGDVGGVGRAVGSTGGVLAGGATGAAIGTAILPGAGTIVGGAIGALAGSELGGEIGEYIGEKARDLWNVFFGDDDEPVKKTVNNRNNVDVRIEVTAPPGADPREFAEHIQQTFRTETQDALFDTGGLD